MVQKQDPVLTREAVQAVAGWLDGGEAEPSRSELANACRRTARTLAEELPGHSVELRVPPFVAVQCVEGPRHTRGTPPNVVEMDARTWLRLATGLTTLDDELKLGTVDASGSRAAEIAAGLPVIALH
ncbi:sterol carrier family protein [Corynebacterium jeddahense]|uniref:Bacterial SCP orthologue domain-containing protein n=1 Tax=Corynebacterium jeddahense TaxID=1414719 RepID=A0ABY7UMH1_9CORY|nr:sterol carrier family protein [Corynebacterium jeddahense]WCZ39574.1 hypothetical protein CJEDD_10015 [Corynebacterium jeddahense]